MRPRALAALALGLAACEGERSIFLTANDRATDIAALGAVALTGFTLAGLAMWGLLLWAVGRRRGSFDRHAPVDAPDHKPLIAIGGIVVPGAAFLALLIVSLILMAAADQPHHRHQAPEIRVVGHRWWWEVHYLGERPDQRVVSANEIHIPAGRPVVVALESADVIHSFWVPALGGKVDLLPGHENAIRLEAEHPGEYHGQCAELCGVQHANMKLVVVAHEQEEFERWLANERAPARVPADPVAMAGKRIFETKPCAVCHTIRGTRALGRIGPDLTHLASRRKLATNMLPMNKAYLAGWATRAHAFKPGVRMPNLAVLSGAELEALATYLVGLE